MRMVLGVSVLLLSGTAEAGPLASIRDDLDGNGTQESIELTADGVVHVGDGPRADVKVASAVTQGRILVAKGTGGTQLVIDVTTTTTHEAVVLDRAKSWREVTRFALGGVGLDREYVVEVDASPRGVVRYQSRFDVKRCDDKPSYLFAEKLEGGTFKKLDKIPTNVPDTATTIAARLDTATATAPLIYQAKSVSHQAGASDAGALAIPRELDDGRLDTAWREDLPSSGEGQFFTFKSRLDTAKAQQLRIVPGNPTSQANLKASNRPRGMAIVSKQGAWRFELPDAAGDPLGAAYIVDLPPGVTDCVTVVLESVYGKTNGTTAIAELGIYAELNGLDERKGGGAALLAKVVSEGKASSTSAAAALSRLGKAGATAIDAELARTTDAGARRRLVGALVKIQDPAAAASLVKAASEGWVRDKDMLDLIGALAANGQTLALRDLAAKSGLPVEIRVAAASKIVAASPQGFAALVEVAGKGPRELRHAVIERLKGADSAMLAQAAAAATDAAAAGDLWRALTRSARGNPANRAAAVTAMTAALPTATDYERRYRLVDGIATLGDAPALAALDTLLRGLPVEPQTAALRQVAVRGIVSAPRAEAVAMVIAFAKDGDPGVRIAALSALATAESDTAGVWHGADGPDAIDRVIINGLSDNWPDVRRRAATALGGRCQRTAPAHALIYSVMKDPHIDVRDDALTALVECKAVGVGELLARVWDDSKLPIRLRQHAIGLVPMLGDRQLAATLVGKFTRWRGQSLESKEAMLLAESAAGTIGTMGPPGAAQALTDALDDSAFPEIVSSSAMALGALGKACPPAAKAKLTALSRSTDQSAVAARHAAAQCGR